MISVTPWLPGWPRLTSPFPGAPMRGLPSLIVIHSGETSPAVAEYLFAPMPRRVSCHFAWSQKIGGLVQMVPLDHEALHAGCGNRTACPEYRSQRCKGAFEGQRLNSVSWGIELPGPFNKPRTEQQYAELDAVLGQLLPVAPIKAIAFHSALCRLRRDPGPWFDAARLEKYGLEVLTKHST